MEILKNILNRLEKSKAEKEKELKKQQEIRAEAASHGDLSENQDYEDACKNINNLSQELLNIHRILYDADTVEETELVDLIEVGTWFNLRVEVDGKMFEKSDIPDNLSEFLYYDEEAEKTIFNHEVNFGAPLDDYIDEFIWSTTSDLAEFLLGKPKGVYTYSMPNGMIAKLEVSERGY